MTPEEWHKVKEVLQTALELDPGARAGFLDSAARPRVPFAAKFSRSYDPTTKTGTPPDRMSEVFPDFQA